MALRRARALSPHDGDAHVRELSRRAEDEIHGAADGPRDDEVRGVQLRAPARAAEDVAGAADGERRHASGRCGEGGRLRSRRRHRVESRRPQSRQLDRAAAGAAGDGGSRRQSRARARRQRLPARLGHREGACAGRFRSPGGTRHALRHGRGRRSGRHSCDRYPARRDRTRSGADRLQQHRRNWGRSCFSTEDALFARFERFGADDVRDREKSLAVV